ncbi:MAG: hypothetical protein ACKOGH_15310 [Alphaproteobacteria bacterium]
MDTRRRSDPGRRLLIALPLALAPAAALARGEAVEWGQVHGSVHAPMPEGLAISPRALDDRPENIRRLRKLGDALRQAGRRSPPSGAPLALNFDTEVERVPQRLHRGVADTRGRVKFAISLTIDEAASGRRCGSGAASYLAPANDEATIFDQIARVLVDEIGRSPRVRGFTLE